ncbi:hypothetical protein MFIFM68171_02065 [Madurella fahalii]|uniref:Uncharacterized protein n=1 Tax=Madurella fahalii TaxID=1157608 RepID=A0ABQ0G270_9PEZI
MPADSTSSWTTVRDFLQNGDSRATSCFRRTQWDQLCLIASDANRHLECVALDQVTCGLNNVVRLLEFLRQESLGSPGPHQNYNISPSRQRRARD